MIEQLNPEILTTFNAKIKQPLFELLAQVLRYNEEGGDATGQETNAHHVLIMHSLLNDYSLRYPMLFSLEPKKTSLTISFHDLGEVATGDMTLTKQVKRPEDVEEHKKKELLAFNSLLEELYASTSNSESHVTPLRKLYEAYHEQNSLAAVYTKIIDRISGAQSALQLGHLHNDPNELTENVNKKVISSLQKLGELVVQINTRILAKEIKGS
jgi:5'-deoxynucleotidase YfbR-like HD superfamily hydrolase